MDVHAALGPAAQSSDFEPKDLIPDPVHYGDSFADPGNPDLEVTPKIGGVYVKKRHNGPRACDQA